MTISFLLRERRYTADPVRCCIAVPGLFSFPREVGTVPQIITSGTAERAEGISRLGNHGGQA